MTQIKICGVSAIDQAAAAIEAGADFIGMVFAESRRQITADKAREISRGINRGKKHVQIVGVFADFPIEETNRIAEYCGLNRVQLSGHETWEYCLKIRHPIIKTIHISPGVTAVDVIPVLEEGTRILKGKDYIFMLDTGFGKIMGGTGMVFDWSIAKEAAARFPVMIAGGLTPQNVRKLIELVHPLGVDVSGGVESDGIKDPAKIRAFIQAVKQADMVMGEGGSL